MRSSKWLNVILISVRHVAVGHKYGTKIKEKLLFY